MKEKLRYEVRVYSGTELVNDSQYMDTFDQAVTWASTNTDLYQTARVYAEVIAAKDKHQIVSQWCLVVAEYSNTNIGFFRLE